MVLAYSAATRFTAIICIASYPLAFIVLAVHMHSHRIKQHRRLVVVTILEALAIGAVGFAYFAHVILGWSPRQNALVNLGIMATTLASIWTLRIFEVRRYRTWQRSKNHYEPSPSLTLDACLTALMWVVGSVFLALGITA